MPLVLCATIPIARLRHSNRVVGLARYHLYKLLLALPRSRTCTLCGWTGRRFLTFVHRHVLCPSCGSQVRHRLACAALFASARGRCCMRGTVLHLSPEYGLGLVLKPQASRYLTGDLATSDADLRLDATALPIGGATVDLVVACDTLEHVIDDAAVFREMHRVLRPGGMALLTVPEAEDLEATFEDPDCTDPSARRRVFGQFDHVRLYGRDFRDRVSAAGFEVTEVDHTAFDADRVSREVLYPPVPLTGPHAWNDRRIYLATRSGATA